MKTWKIPITWEASYFVEVEADTVEEAIKKALDYEEKEGYSIPYNGGEFVDGSFKIETDEEIVGMNNEDNFDDE